MADIGKLLMKVEADTKNFDKGMSKSKKSLAAFKKAAKTAAIVVGTAFVATSAKAIALASDAEEMQNKFNVTFKTMSDDAEKWAKTFASATGRSVNDTKGFLSNIADLQQGLRMSEDASLDLSKKIVELGTDLASFNNLNDSDAIEAVSKAMLGEADSAKSLGLLLNVDRVKAFAEAQGKVWDEVTDAERAMLTYELAVEQSQNALGDAERSSGSFANQMKRLKSFVKDTSIAFGQKLLPIATKFITWLNDVLPRITAFKKAMQEAFITTMKPVIEIANEVVSKFVEFVKSQLPLVQEVFTKVFNEAKRRAEALTNYFVENVLPILQEIIAFVIEKFPLWQQMFEKVFKVVWDVSKTLFDFFVTNLLPIIQKVVEYVVSNLPWIEETARKVFGGIIEVAEKMWLFFKDNILPIIETLMQVSSDVFPVVFDVFKTAFDGILTIATTLWDFFEKHLLPIFQAIFDKVNDVIPKLAPIFEAIFGTIADVIGGVVDTIMSFIGWVDTAIKKFKEFTSLSKAGSGTTGFVIGGTGGATQGTGTIKGQFANGGNAMVGGSYLVGEKGPEIFTPGTNGTVSPVSGSNITFNITTQDPDLVMSRVVQYLNQQGITGR